MQYIYKPQSAPGSKWIRNFKKYTLSCFLSLTLLSACGQRQISGDSAVEGVNKYEFRLSNGIARLAIAFANLHMDAGAVIPLLHPAGASVEVGPDFESGGVLFAISVPLASLLNGNIGLPLLGLPDGRAIPDVRVGAIQGSAVQLPLFGITYLYIGKDVFGLFLPLPLPNTSLIARSRMRDELGNTLGYIYGIPKSKSKEISGVLVLLPVEGSAAARFLNSVT